MIVATDHCVVMLADERLSATITGSRRRTAARSKPHESVQPTTAAEEATHDREFEASVKRMVDGVIGITKGASEPASSA